MEKTQKNSTSSVFKYFGYLSIASLIVLIVMLLIGYRSETGPFAILLFVSLALFFTGNAFLRGFSFTVWVFASVAASMYYPGAFMTWSGFDLGVLITPLIQIIMFGMGTTLSVKDFTRIITMPWPVFIGMILQFSVMPVAGLTIATLFGFDPEIAAGVVLIGSCPGGVASNLMAYLAGGNVALSVTMTSCSTLLSPVMTPFLMLNLAGQLVPIDFMEMMISIFNMIIVPIVAGLIANRILYSASKWANGIKTVSAVSLASVVIALISGLYGSFLANMQSGIVIGFALIGSVAAAKLIIGLLLHGPENWMDRTLPIVSMAGIVVIISIITARARDQLLVVGLVVIAAGVIHNAIGYLLGYWGSRLARLEERDCRTVAFEVGMQNGGMASGLAMNVLRSANAAIAPAIFGPWMNISGSVLATWWHRSAAKPEPEPDRVS